MFAVASVIKNRASRRGKSPADIIREPDQFTGYSAPGEGVRKAMEDPAMRAMAETALEGVFSGKTPDPTGGADHYHATYVSPSWAKGMPETARFGKHIFYNSKPGEKQPDSAGAIESAWAQKPEEQPGLGRQAFDAVLNPAADRPEGSAPNPEAKGLARLVRPDEEKPNRGGGNLSFVHKGQDAIAPEFMTILTESSSALGRDFTIQSGYRAPNHPVEARKEKPGQHTSRTAADISLKGMNESERAALVQDLYSRGVRRFGTYTNMPDVLHVDMKDQTGKGSPWFMHDTSNKFIGRAPKWFQNIATNPGEPRAVARNTGPVEGIVVGEDFAISDPLGLMGGANPLAETAKRDGEAARAAQAQAQAEAERQGMITANTQANEASEAEFQRLSGQDPDRYEMVPASELDQWSTKWKAENQSTSRFGDFWKNWGIGASQTSQGMENLNRLAISKLPYGDKINAGLDSIDRWFGNGKTKAERMQETDQVQEARLSDKSQAALKKTVFNEDGSFGEALTDPDWYLAQVARSAPATVASMAPGGFMARGAYVTAVARGASAEVAAATAARTATIAGGITEGIMGGADAALSVKQQIAQIPREALLETDAVKTLIGEGMTEDAAIEAVSNNVQTQAMVAAGVATGIFGGMGDRALAKIIGEGVSGNIASRTAKGAVKGAVSESLFEEAPQSAGSQVAENWAMQTVEPGRKLSEGVAEATVSGAAVGGAMGGAMGGAGGAISRAEPAPPATAAKGPLGRAVEYGNQRADERAASQPDVQPIMGGQTPAGQSTAPAPTSSQFTDGRPEIRSTVRVDAEGVEPFMGQVEGYDGDEAIIVDGGSGEVYQIPISSITKIADAPDRVNAVDQAIERKRSGEPIPEYSNDPALEPDAPRAADIKTEPAPAGSLVPASSRLNFPKPGSRVTVEADGIKSFTGRVERYTGENGDEAIVVDDDNKPYQVPLSALKVSGLTPKQIEAEDLARNPPIPREIGDAGPLSRKIGKATVKLPDERHADLYDFAKEKFISSRLAGASQLEVNERLKPHAQKLADAFGISPEAVMQMADDYRFRVERAAASSNSALPVNMNPYDAKRLRKWQAEAKGEDLSTAESPESWWDLALTDADRKRILAQAGVKRSEKHTWGSLSKAIQQKLLPYQPKGEAAEDVNPIDFSGVPDSVFSIFPDMKVTPDGLLPLNHFSRDQQTALKKAGLVTTAATKDGGEYEGVDPAHLWPERDRRAKEQSKNPSKEITPEERNAAIERNATIYDRAADEEEENGSEDRAAEYRAKARELRARKAKLGTSAKRASSESDVTEMVDAYLDYRADWFEQEGVPLDDPDVAEYMRRTALARDESDSDRADRSEAERNLIEKHGKNFTNVLQADWSDFRDNPAEHGYQPAASTDNAARVSNDGDYSALVAAYLDESAQWLEDAGFLYDKDVPEYLRRAAQARDEEKTSDPADWSKDESEAWASKNWKRFSELRGYSPSEIANFERYLELSDKLAERHGINSVVMLHTDWADFRARRAEPEGQPAASIDDAAREAATSPTNDRPEPTQAQKEAGNYKVGRIKLAGMDISIENPAGSERKGVDGSGKPWSVTMKSHYGYIRGTVGRDKDHIDVFVKPGTEALDGSAPVFVVNQTSPNGRFDEHKVMLGYASQEEAEAAYLENYTKGWKLGPVSPTTIDGFKSWLLDGDKQRHFREVGSEPDAAEVASLYKELADRLPPADFARKVASGAGRA